MKILVMGAGAVGGYFGARLAEAGNHVFFVARGTHLETIREKGLRLRSPGGDLDLKLPASDRAAEAGVVELVFLAVKAQDVEKSLDQIQDCVGPETIILTVQNGVEAEDKVSSRFGREKVLAGVAYIGVRVEEPGLIVHTTLGRLAIGELDGSTTPRLQRVERVIKEVGIPVTISENIMTTKWRKLVWNAAYNPVSVVTGLKTRAMAKSAELRPVLTHIMEEVMAVAAAEGCHLDKEEILGTTFQFTASLDNVKTSMLQDFEKGKPLETEGITGVVVRKGREHGVPTPVNETIYKLVKVLEMKRDSI